MLFRSDALTIFSGAAGNKIVDLYVNTSNSLSGATQVARFLNTTTAGGNQISRKIIIDSNTSLRLLGAGGGSTGIGYANIAAATTTQSVTIPTLANTTYWMLSINRANSGDQITAEFLRLTPFTQ